jgi:hypothetical protein
MRTAQADVDRSYVSRTRELEKGAKPVYHVMGHSFQPEVVLTYCAAPVVNLTYLSLALYPLLMRSIVGINVCQAASATTLSRVQSGGRHAKKPRPPSEPILTARKGVGKSNATSI